MITKIINNHIGYGYTAEEAEVNCYINGMLKDPINIREFGYEAKRLELAPWTPRKNSLHIKGVNYLQIRHDSGNSYVYNDDRRIKITKSLFKTLYDVFFNHLSLLELSLCMTEVEDFFKINGFDFKRVRTFPQIIPEDIYLEDNDVSAVVVTMRYTFVFYTTNKFSYKRNDDEFYWTCFLPNKDLYSTIDAIYYIAYLRGYSDINDYIIWR